MNDKTDEGLEAWLDEVTEEVYSAAGFPETCNEKLWSDELIRLAYMAGERTRRHCELEARDIHDDMPDLSAHQAVNGGHPALDDDNNTAKEGQCAPTS